MNAFSTRLKLLAASGIVAGSLGVAAVSGAFAAPQGVALAASTPTAATATPASGAAPSTTSTTAPSSPAATAPRPGRPWGGPWMGFGPGSMSGIAGFLGISEADLQTALHNGQSLAQIAQAHGKSASDLKTFMTNELKTKLDQAVSNGKLTSQQETDMLNAASTHLDNLINNPLPKGPRNFRGPGPGRGPGFGDDPQLFQTAAQTLGMNVTDLRTELQSGKTLAQIATEHGKTGTDIENALIAAYKTHLDQLINTNFQQRLQQHPGRPFAKPAGTTTPAPTATPTSG